MKSASLLLFIGFIFLSSAEGQSPLRIRSDLPVEFLVNKILLEENADLKVSNIRYHGNPLSIGAFSNSSKYYLIKKGIILSTGNAEDAIGPNQYNDMGFFFNSPGSSKLEKIATGRTFDACELSFEFISTEDSINFNFIFASEEYPEYVHKGVNDVFAFFMEDLSTNEIRNLAVVTKKALPVNVDNINSLRNPELFIENGIWEAGNVLKWKSNPGLGELALTYEFDGFTTLLETGSSVVPGRTYRITFVIADVGDGLYDSAVFLEAGSFTSQNSGKESSYSALEKELITDFNFSSKDLKKDNSSLTFSFAINFEFDRYETNDGESLAVLNELSRFLKLHSDLQMSISGHTDNYGSNEYNIDLSLKRAAFAKEYLIDSGIEVTRLSFKGYGDDKPVADNVTENGRRKNRRLEFEIYRP